jgi:antitoxin MazE
MFKRLTKVGNSQGILIDKAILDLLGVPEDGGFNVDIEGKKLLLTPATSDVRTEKFRRGKKKIFERHARAFAKLSK